MKTTLQLIAAGGMVSIIAGTGFAIEGPPDNAPPPEIKAPAPAPQVEAEAEAPPAEAPVQAAAAYLGVASGPIPEILASHLQLPAGEGVVVRNVLPEGPAATAGIAEHDVITRIGGKPVHSREELRELTLAHSPGDEVEIDLIHQGKPLTRTVVLGSREDAVAVQPGNLQFEGMMEGLPQEQAQRLREAIERLRGAGAEGLPGLQGLGEIAPIPPMADVMREMQERMAEVFKNGGIDVPQADNAQVRSHATIRISDPEGSIEMKSRDDSKELTVRGLNDEIIWTGPWDTDQDKAAAPEDIRQRVEAMNLDDKFKGKGLRFNLKFNGENPAVEPAE